MFELTPVHLLLFRMLCERPQSGGCNDLLPEEEELLTPEEWKEFCRAYHEWNGDPETFAERTNYVLSDFMVRGFVTDILFQSYRKLYQDER